MKEQVSIKHCRPQNEDFVPETLHLHQFCKLRMAEILNKAR